MKFSLAVAASMATATMATPIFGDHKWGLKWGNKKEEVAAKGPCEFHPHLPTSQPTKQY